MIASAIPPNGKPRAKFSISPTTTTMAAEVRPDGHLKMQPLANRRGHPRVHTVPDNIPARCVKIHLVSAEIWHFAIMVENVPKCGRGMWWGFG